MQLMRRIDYTVSVGHPNRTESTLQRRASRSRLHYYIVESIRSLNATNFALSIIPHHVSGIRTFLKGQENTKCDAFRNAFEYRLCISRLA